jgi:hypothetical protein
MQEELIRASVLFLHRSVVPSECTAANNGIHVRGTGAKDARVPFFASCTRKVLADVKQPWMHCLLFVNNCREALQRSGGAL